MAKISVDAAKAWDQALAVVGQTLAQTLAGIDRRQAMLDALAESDVGAAEQCGQDLQAVQDKVHAMETLPERAHECIRAFDQMFETEEEQLKTFLRELDEQRQRLAEWQARAIG